MAAEKKKSRNSKPSVLVVGDGIFPTGFRRVIHSILERLLQKYEFHHLAVNFHGGDHDCPWEVYQADKEGDYFGTNRLAAMVEELQPDVVFLVNDLWVIVNYVAALEPVRHKVKVVVYTPIDSAPIDPGLMVRTRDLDMLVLYTEFGRRTVQDAVELVQAAQPDFRYPETRIIPHGIDTDLFHPWSSENAGQGRKDARRELFHHEGFSEAFIVLNANRNQPRKRIDITMKGFARFAEDKPENVKLYLHMGVEDCGWNVISLARRFGIEDNLILTADTPHLPAVTDDVLNCIYNVCDVGINTSIGEGWGLVSFEHGATGAAQVVPRHSACEELWQDSGLLMEPAVTLTSERSLAEGHFVMPEEVARALDLLYADPELLAQVSERSYRRANLPEFSWSRIAEQWDQLFQETIAKA